MRNIKAVLMICPLIFAIISLAVSCRNQKSHWKGIISTENGVLIVRNPKEPMYGEEALALSEDLSIGKSTSEGGHLFSSIRSIAVDEDGNIYVLDGKENYILVFDNTGKHLRTFGRPGQGPGELTLPLTLGLTNRDELVIENTRSRLVYYSAQGEYIRSLSIAKAGVARIALDSRGNILGIVIKRDKDDRRYVVQKFDPEMNLLFSLDSTPTPSSDNQGFNPFSGSIYYTFDKNDRVVCSIPDRYEIKIYDTTGKWVKKILKEYDPVEITEEEMKEIAEEMPPYLKLAIPRFHDPIRWISTDDEGKIFAMTWERIPDKEGYYHDVFDQEGRYLAKIPFTSRPFLIKKNKYYTVTEDEEGFHIVKRFHMEWRMDE